MGRFAILAIATAIVAAGCAGPRVRSAGSTASARGTALPGMELIMSDEFGVPDPGARCDPGEYPPTRAQLYQEIARLESMRGPDAKIDALNAEIAALKAKLAAASSAETPGVDIDAPAPPGADARRLTRTDGSPVCCPTYPCGNPCGGYGGISVNGLPGLGAGAEFGVNFKNTRKVMWSWEMGIQYQDLTAAISGESLSGKYFQLRAGVRARFKPCCKGHPTLRAGVSWFNVTGDPIGIDTAQIDSIGDYLGGYLGLGYEWDIGRRWSTGPEAAITVGTNVNNGDIAIVPTVFWHFNYRF